jgi:hypothetical protein
LSTLAYAPCLAFGNGRAVLIAYAIYRGPQNQYGRIPGVLGRSEFGMEIVVEIAYLVYVLGLSFDKACLTLQFLQNLHVGKTQADRLLHQLARHWQGEFDILCTLLANSLVVHADETSWSIHSVWAFLSEKARVLFFGVHHYCPVKSRITTTGYGESRSLFGRFVGKEPEKPRFFQKGPGSKSAKCRSCFGPA